MGDNELTNLNQRELSDIRLNNIGFVFQAYNLIPVLTSLENVEYVLLLQGVDREERRKRSIDILREVGLENEINRRPKELWPPKKGKRNEDENGTKDADDHGSGTGGSTDN